MRFSASHFLPSPRGPLTLAWAAALWIGTVCNWPLWQRMAALSDLQNAQGLIFIAVFAGIVTALSGALLSLLAWRVTIKPVLTVALLSAAALAYFMGSYGVVIDPTMVVNILQTDSREAGDLLNGRLGLSLLVLAGLPLAWLRRQKPLTPLRWAPRLGLNLLSFAAGIGLTAGLVFSSFAELASTMRNEPQLRYMINPLNLYWSVGVVVAEANAKPAGPPKVVGADAHLADRPAGAKPPLLMLVVGETARASSFSLNGYARPTNPELAKLPVLNFANVTSCGTSTAASLPCMFSHLGREAYGGQKSHQENLLDLLQRAGLAVLWLDNQSGCKGLCDRVPSSSATQPAAGAPPLPAGLCDTSGECLDEALLSGLDQRLAALDPARVARGVVLVMHQMGSHGPAYYKRSPPELKLFQPECKSNALQQCQRAQVVNAYDNSIVTTDRLLARSIAWLQSQSRRFDTRLYYVSDHGESLGENNIFLHGMPYAVAPRDQIHVPMLLWLGDAPALEQQCLKGKRDQPLSHDNLFHTVLGLMGVQTTLYRAEWDFIASCRSAG
ncbi:phosphoethanolamine--lipid A transferase [soil metagenome]